MPENQEPSYDTLKRRLEAAESALEAVRNGQIDAIIGDREALVIRLKETEAREAHIKQVLLAIRNVNQLIVKETDPERLIDHACANLTETLGYHNAWIALLNEDSHVIRTAASGFDGGFEVMEDRLRQGHFPFCMQQTLAQDTLIVVEDPVNECRDCPLAREYEGRAELTRRLSHGGKTYGILSVSVPAAFAGDTEEQELFEELTDDLAFALYRIETEEHTRRLTHIVNTLPQPMSFVSRDYRYVAVNDFYAELYGLPQDRIIEKGVADFFGEAVFEAEIKPRLDRCLDGKTVSYEIQADFPDKGKRWMAMKYHPYHDERGNITAVVSHGLDITDRKRTEETLRLHSMTLNQIEDRVTVTDLDGYITYVNEAACRMLGKPRDELLGRHVSAYGDDPSTGASQEEIVQKTLQDGIWRGEVTNYRADGSAAILDCRVQVVRDEERRPVALCGISTDITERREKEEALRESEGKLRAMFDAAPLAIVLLDREGRVLDSNHVHAERLKTTRDEILDQRIWDILPQSVRADRKRRVGQVFETGEPFSGEDERDGTWNEYYIQPAIIDEKGEVQAVIVAALDITDRKQAEEALRGSEHQKNLILNATAEMVAYYDLDLRVIWANRAAAESVGRTPADLEGLHCYEIWDQRNDPCPGCPVLKARDTGTPQNTERQSPDGRYWFLRGYPILDDQGKPFALVEFGQDITEQKQAEERHAQLEEQMRQAQKLESVGLLAGGVAHDFNNMLGIIIANAELAEMETGAGAPVYPHLQEILKAGHRAADTVRQLLAFARKQPISPKVLDFNDTVSGILKMLHRIIGENINLRFLPGREVWNVRMDPAQVHQILTNLVVNSRDAMPDGGRIAIETANKVMDESYTHTHNGLVPGDYVLLMVSDTGEGMPSEVLAHLFDPFFTTKEVGRGTGLGLATVYGMVKQNSGFIYAYSEPGRGTTVKIYLPRYRGERTDDQQKAVKKDIPKGNETILVAEDEDVLLQTCKYVLERQGYTVLMARKPGEALALAEQHSGEIHLLLTDVVMPEMNGRELAEKLQALQPKTKCLFMSGYTADVVARHGVLEQGVDFIEKPFSFTGLAEKVRGVLDKDIAE